MFNEPFFLFPVKIQKLGQLRKQEIKTGKQKMRISRGITWSLFDWLKWEKRFLANFRNVKILGS